MAREWQTKRVRAYNLLPGDVLDYIDTERNRTSKLTVHWVDTNHVSDDLVRVGFRRKLFGWKLERMKLVRVRRLVGPNGA